MQERKTTLTFPLNNETYLRAEVIQKLMKNRKFVFRVRPEKESVMLLLL